MIVTKMGSRVYSQDSFSETLVTGGSDDGDAVFDSGICRPAGGKMEQTEDFQTQTSNSINVHV